VVALRSSVAVDRPVAGLRPVCSEIRDAYDADGLPPFTDIQDGRRGPKQSMSRRTSSAPRRRAGDRKKTAGSMTLAKNSKVMLPIR